MVNISAGFKCIVKHPVILILPIILQVFISFAIGVLALLGVGLYSFGSLDYGSSPTEFNIQFTLPIFIPMISDLKQSLSFLPINGEGNIVWTILYTIFYCVAISFTIAMYLGSMKKVLVPGSLDNFSMLQIGFRYFGRMFLYQVFSTILSFVSFFLLISTIIGGIIGFILLLLYILAPYIVVLEEKSLGTALLNSPKYWKRFIGKFIPLALGTMFTILMLSFFLQFLNESFQYYVGLIAYTYLGTGFIGAFMNLLNTCIHRGEQNSHQKEEFKYSKWKKWTIVVLVFLLPWFGLQFANGKQVIALQLQPKTTLSDGLYFKSGWSPANIGSNRTYTTYGFEQGDALEVKMTFPEPDTVEALYGEGEVTWIVDKERITRNGNSTHHWGEEVVETSKFLYRLIPVDKNGTLYYTTNAEGGFAKITTADQSDELMGMEIFIMNNGNDVFVFQYKERFDPQTVIQISDDGKYFIPRVSPVNPGDFKYFWYSKDLFTKDIMFDFMKSKNSTDFTINGDPSYYDYAIIAAALLQQADGEALVQLGEEYDQHGVQTNISKKSAEQWTTELKTLYADVHLSTFLHYFNKQNEHDGYDVVGMSHDGQRDEYQVYVPFPKGFVKLHCVSEDGELVEMEIELP